MSRCNSSEGFACGALAQRVPWHVACSNCRLYCQGGHMSTRMFALIFGLVFLATGIAGFIPGLLTPHDAVEHQLRIQQGAGDLLGLFPTNVLHNIVHLAFGVWGLAVYRSTSASIGYARAVA